MEELIEQPNYLVKVFENHQIFVITDDPNNKKKYYFRANDIAKAIGIKNISSSTQNFSDKEKLLHEVYTLRGKQDALFLTSKGLR